MQDIPDVLRPLVEFEEEDGTPIEWCDAECGDVLCGEKPLTNWQDEPFPQWTAFNEDTGEEMLCVSACPRCGTLVGATEDGRPYRIPFAKIMGALEHRDRALEWLKCIETLLREYPDPISFRTAIEDLLRDEQAALAATEEE